MDVKEAHRLLHPDTTVQAIAEAECYGGFNGRAKAMEAINEACLVACEALEKQMPAKISLGHTYCPVCGTYSSDLWNPVYCGRCGKRLKWGIK